MSLIGHLPSLIGHLPPHHINIESNLCIFLTVIALIYIFIGSLHLSFTKQSKYNQFDVRNDSRKSNWVVHSDTVLRLYLSLYKLPVSMKPTPVADEMFPEGAGPYMDLEEAGGSTSLLMDLAANEKAVHADFFNDFDDLYDDSDLE